MVAVAFPKGIAPSARIIPGPDPGGPQIAAVSSVSVSNITWKGALFTLIVNNYGVACTVQVEYGQTTNYGSTTVEISLPALDTNQSVQFQVHGLFASAGYHVRGRAQNYVGQGLGPDVTFTTLPVGGVTPSVPGSPPLVAVVGASNPVYDSVTKKFSSTLSGTVSRGPGWVVPLQSTTTARIGIRRVGDTSVFAYYNQQSISTTSAAPVPIDVLTGNSLLGGGEYEFIVEATNSKGVVTTDPFAFSVPAADFALSISPGSQSIVAGQAASFTISNVTSNGFNGALSLSDSGSPGTATFTPNPMQPDSSALLSIQTTTGTAAGTYSVIVTASGPDPLGNTLTRQIGLSLTVAAAPTPDFSLSVVGPSTVAAGSNVQATVSNVAVNGFASAITLSATELPLGVGFSYGFSPNPMAANNSSVLTITTAANTQPQQYVVTITGTGGAITHTTALTLTVTPPVGSAPLCDTLSSANITAGGALLTLRGNNNNATIGHTDLYLRYALQSSPTQYTQVGPINSSSITGNANVDIAYQLGGLTPSTDYTFWAFASNEFGTADDFATRLNFTTNATAAGTISIYSDSEWIGHDQLTLFCSYATAASGSWQIKWYYASSQSGPFTLHTTENVAVNTSGKVWDMVMGGFDGGADLWFRADITDGSTVVASNVLNVPLATGSLSVNKSGTALVWLDIPGKGPGSRGTPVVNVGQPATLSNIQTYADPRRPSSGLITYANVRKYIPNAQADPTNYPANKAWHATFDPDGVNTLGADITVLGSGHGLATHADGSACATWDIVVWNKQMVLALGGTTPPYIIRQTQHNLGSLVTIWAIKALARHSDVVIQLGVSRPVLWTGTKTDPSTNQACWAAQISTKAKVIVGVAIRGGVATTDSRRGGTGPANPGAVGISSTCGSVVNVYHNRLYFYASGCNQGEFYHGLSNAGTQDNPQYNCLVGLWGVSGNRCEANPASCGGLGVKRWFRIQGGRARYDIRDNILQFAQERAIYLDSPSALICGDEGNGVAGPSWIVNNSNYVGLITNPAFVGDGKNPIQIDARKMDNVVGSPYGCPTGCPLSCDCGGGKNVGPDGVGDLYIRANSGLKLDAGATNAYTIAGHGGRVFVEDSDAKESLLIGADNACCHLLRPVFGADGRVYAHGDFYIENYATTKTTCEGALIRADSTTRLQVMNLQVPAGFNKPVIAMACGNYSGGSGTSATIYQGQRLGSHGYFKLDVDPNAVGKWPSNALNKVWFGWSTSANGGPHPFNYASNNPPIIATKYTAAQLAVCYTDGVCAEYQYDPLLQPAAFACPNNA